MVGIGTGVGANSCHGRVNGLLESCISMYICMYTHSYCVMLFGPGGYPGYCCCCLVLFRGYSELWCKCQCCYYKCGYFHIIIVLVVGGKRVV